MTTLFVRSVVFTLTLAASVAAQNIPTFEMGLLPGDVAVLPAVNSQQDQSVAKGDDAYLVVWGDWRGRDSGSQTSQADGDIFGIRLDMNGSPIDAAPFLIAGGMGLQQRPLVAWNGQAWLVLFVSQDPVGGYFGDRLRAVRVDAQAQILDSPSILFPPSQFSPDTIGLQLSGQAGQWLVTRCLYHDDGYGTFLAGQRIDANGQLLDVTPVMLIDWVYGATTLVAAGGEYLAAGLDWNNSATAKARRIGLNVQPLGPEFNVPSTTIASNGAEYYVVWIADYVNLVGSRVTSNGTLLTPAGTVIVSNFAQFTHATLTHDGTNWWVEWGVSDILRTVRINAAGVVLDPGGGVLLPISIGGNVNTAYNTRLAPRTGGGVTLFWYDLRVALGYDTNVFALPINAANVAGVERCISTGTRNQRNSALSDGPNRTAAIAFVSEAVNDDRVLVHLLDAAGRPLTIEPIQVAGASTIGRVGIGWNGTVFMIAWDEGTNGQNPTQIKARRMNPDGTFVEPQPFDVMPGFNAAVGALDGNFLVAATRFGTYPQNIFLVGNRIDGASGAVLDGAGGLLLGGFYVSGAPRVRSDGTQWFVAAHSQWSHDASQGDAILARVPAAGPPVMAVNPTPFSGASGDLDIAFSGNKYLLVWRMNSLANANNYVAGRIMNVDGTFPPGYFTIAEAPGRQLRPTVTWDGQTFLVAWDDQRNQASFFDARTDVYGARVSEAGVVLDPSAFAIVLNGDGDCSPDLLSRDSGVTLVSSTRFTQSTAFDSYRIGLTQIGLAPVAGDINGDGRVNETDLGALLGAFGTCAGQPAYVPAADFDLSGCVDESDLGVLLGGWTG